jgi:thymidylate synthase
VRQHYDRLLQKLLLERQWKNNRTGVRTVSLYGESVYADLTYSFPILWAKSIHWKSVKEELLWFLRGETNVRSLQAAGVRIWDEWADANGDLGRVYGAQWRTWTTPSGDIIDQIAQVEQNLRTDPDSRRHLVTAWNPGELSSMALPPCHYAFQFAVDAERRLHCIVSQRSADVFLGLPFNIPSYALLTHLMASTTRTLPGSVRINIGDAHLYENHVEAANEYIRRTHGNIPPVPPYLMLEAQPSVLDYRPEHIQLVGYTPMPKIPAPVAV